MDPLSLLCRLAASVPAPRFNTVRYAGVLAANAKLRPRILPAKLEKKDEKTDVPDDDRERRASRYRPWAELLKRTFAVDVLQCDKCHGPMKLVAMITDDKSITRFLKKLGEPTEPPPRLPARGPPYWQSRALRRIANDAA
jgi:hypothetical protein